MAKKQDLRDWCRARLTAHSATALRDPMATGVRHLSLDLLERVEAGEIDLSNLGALVQQIGDEALRERAARFRATHPGGTWRALVEAALAPLKGKTFAEIAKAVEAPRGGVVFTGHPTFALSRAMRTALGALATEPAARADLGPHAPDPNITLADEHADASAALVRAQVALRGLSAATFDWLEANADGPWWSLMPAPIRLATWVGYDLDGRTDIHWAQTIRIRLEEKAAQLGRYTEALTAAGAGKLAASLAKAGALVAKQAALFNGDLDDPEAIVAAANALTAETADRLVSLKGVIAEIGAMLEVEGNAAKRKALAIVRAEMAAIGLGVGGIHLRVNASQVRSAVQADLGLEVLNDFFDRRAVSAAADKTAHAKRQSVNFGSIFQEKMTARRQLMLCAEIVKHIDADTPVRFLIAEIESPATIMGAIYLARLYGVYDRLDISPLFETPDVLERGGRFMERLLEEEEYLAYIRARGRLCVQLGFSDSGRFMGQIAADMGIERVHVLLSRALAKANVRDVEVVIFDTHGESMGRGGYPGTLEERFDHLLTPWSRARFASQGIAVHPEVSFQGGDGYLHFETPELADATLRAFAAWSFAPAPSGRIDDAFYGDINFSWDIYRGIKGWQEALFANRHYQAVLGSFAPNLLPGAGSRKTRRQSGSSKDDVARSLRAIPHNAILQQLAAPANVSGGFGHAAAREPEKFATHVAGSPRLERLVRMAQKARQLTSLSILRTYADLYSPGFWTIRAARGDDDGRAEIALRIADRLDAFGLDISIDRLANLLSSDRRRFDTVCRAFLPTAPGDQGFEAELYLLHAVRMVLIVRGFTLAGAIPAFSPRHDISREALVDQALELRFAEVADALAGIFPAMDDTPAAFAKLTEAGEHDLQAGYPAIGRDIAQPLRAIDAQIKQISVAISHFYGAFG
ncbi:phosphoenolpyruvate carboxylase [alpha proteobacterium U9-1i]|nr:phosphoenolpyruvate carboxylase [alpha proteobacterium U9-1i]